MYVPQREYTQSKFIKFYCTKTQAIYHKEGGSGGRLEKTAL